MSTWCNVDAVVVNRLLVGNIIVRCDIEHGG